ncbi:phosphatidylserine decarboxylase [Rhodovibrionaceae bacterium A322]
MDTLKIIAPPIHKEGKRFVGIFAVIALLLFLLWEPLGWIGLGLTVWCYYFFRNPLRVTPTREGLIISPADGKICMVQPAAPPPELGLGDKEMMRISIFMNVFNVHVNRLPIAGKVTKIAYHPGQFLNASLDKASDLNERNSLIVEMKDGRQLAVTQIAGLVARRILCEVKEGQELATGEHYGLIRFGSRLDVYLPDGVEPQVMLGQTMVAGETVLADLNSDEPRRQGVER